MILTHVNGRNLNPHLLVILSEIEGRSLKQTSTPEIPCGHKMLGHKWQKGQSVLCWRIPSSVMSNLRNPPPLCNTLVYILCFRHSFVLFSMSKQQSMYEGKTDFLRWTTQTSSNQIRINMMQEGRQCRSEWAGVCLNFCAGHQQALKYVNKSANIWEPRETIYITNTIYKADMNKRRVKRPDRQN